MSYESPSDFAKIAKLEDETNAIRDILFFESVHGMSQSSPFGQGRKSTELGSELGTKSWFPLQRSVTENDESGTPTGVFDRLDLHALSMVVTGIPTTIPLKFIQHIGDGKIFSLTPKSGKEIELQPGGNIAISVATKIKDTAAGLFQYFEDTGKVKCIAMGDGGGLSEPIIHSIKNYGSSGSPVTTAQDIDLSLTTGNAHRIYLGADIDVTFSGFPGVDKLQPFEIIFVQDATGSRTPTFTTGTIIGSTGIDEGPSAISIKVVQTFDNGTTFYMYDATGGTGGSGGGDNLGNHTATTNLQMSDQDILGVKNIDMDDAASKIMGIFQIDWIQAGQTITTDPAGIVYKVNDVQDHQFFAGIVKIAEFREQAAGVYQLNMEDHSIEDSREIIFSGSADAIIINTEGGIGLDNTADELLYHVPNLYSHQWQSNGEDIMNLVRSGSSQGLLTIYRVDPTFFRFVDAAADPTINGEFSRNSADVKVFSGGAVRNLSNIGVAGGANTALSNLATTSINQTLLPDGNGTRDIGSSALSWDSGWFRAIRFDDDVSAPTGSSPHKISTGTAGMHFNVDDASDKFLWYFNGVNKHEIGPEIAIFRNLTIGDGTSDVGVITLNDLTSKTLPTNGMMYREGADVKIYTGGMEVNISTLGSGGDTITAGDSKVQVIDTGTGHIDFFLDNLSTAKYHMDAVDFTPISDNANDLGTSSIRWRELFIDVINIQDDLASHNPASGETSILADQGGMNLGVAASSDAIDFYFAGVRKFSFEEDRILGKDSNAEHEIHFNSTNLAIISQNENDNIDLWTGSGRTNHTVSIQDQFVDIESETDDAGPMELRFFFRHTAPEGLVDPDVGRIKWIAENTANSFEEYGIISGGVHDATSAAEEGFIQIGPKGDGALQTGIALTGAPSGSKVKLGFFDKATVDGGAIKQTGVAVTASAIHAALVAYGLISA